MHYLFKLKQILKVILNMMNTYNQFISHSSSGARPGPWDAYSSSRPSTFGHRYNFCLIKVKKKPIEALYTTS